MFLVFAKFISFVRLFEFQIPESSNVLLVVPTLDLVIFHSLKYCCEEN